MKIRLLDYNSNEHFAEIPDDTEEITIKIISGDMVITSPIHFDTSDRRIIDFNDGTIVLKKNEFYKLDEAKSSYNLYNEIKSINNGNFTDN